MNNALFCYPNSHFLHKITDLWINMQTFAFKTLRPRQDRCHFPDIFKRIFLIEKLFNFDEKFIEICFPGFKLQYSSIGSDNGFGAGQATSHYLNQWWLNYTTHICVTRPQWVDEIRWISNYIHCFLRNIIIHPSYTFNHSWTKPPLKLGFGWMITSLCFTWMYITYQYPNLHAALVNIFWLKRLLVATIWHSPETNLTICVH